MAEFKATVNKATANDTAFKATKNRSYNATMVNDALSTLKTTDIKGIGSALGSGKWLSSEQIKNYKSQIKKYKSAFDLLNDGSVDFGVDTDSMNADLDALISGFDEADKIYSQYENEDDYNAKREEAFKWDTEHERAMQMDVHQEAADITELDYYIKKVKALKNYAASMKVDAATREWAKAELAELETYGEIDVDKLNDILSERKEFLEFSRRTQTIAEIEKNAKSADDFDEKSKQVPKLEDNESVGGIKRALEYINADDKSQEEMNKIATSNVWSGSVRCLVYQQCKNSGLDWLTEEEKKIATYLGNTDEEKYHEYLKALEPKLKQLAAIEDAKRAEGNFFAAAGNAFESNIDRIEQSIIGKFNEWTGNDEIVDPTRAQLASGYIREDLGVVGRAAYDTLGTVTYMMPSLVVGTATGGVGAAITTYTLSSGDAYNNALQNGMDKYQAQTYATLVGGAEAGLQYLIGGVSKLGGKLSVKAVEASTKGINKAFARFAARMAGSAISEGFEEGLQEVLDPVFHNVAVGYKEKEVNWGDVAYSAALGALTASILEGPSIAANVKAEQNLGKQIASDTELLNSFVSAGKSYTSDSAAYILAQKIEQAGVDENGKTNAKAYELARLAGEVEGGITLQTERELVTVLKRKGMLDKDARTHAKFLAAAAEGKKFTKAQVDALNTNDVAAAAFMEVVVDENSKITAARRAIAQLKALNGEGYGLGIEAMAETKARAEEFSTVRRANETINANNEFADELRQRAVNSPEVIDEAIGSAPIAGYNPTIGSAGASLPSSVSETVNRLSELLTEYQTQGTLTYGKGNQAPNNVINSQLNRDFDRIRNGQSIFDEPDINQAPETAAELYARQNHNAEPKLTEDQQVVLNFAKKFKNLTVKFVDKFNSERKLGTYSNNTIYLKGGDNAIYKIFVHEFTHYLEQTTEYAGYAKVVLNSPMVSKYVESLNIKSVRTVNDYINRVIEIEKAENGRTVSREHAECELVAHFTTDVLFRRATEGHDVFDEFYHSIKQEHPEQAKGFFAAIKNFLRKICDLVTGHRYKSQFADLERRFSKMVAEAEQKYNSGSDVNTDISTDAQQKTAAEDTADGDDVSDEQNYIVVLDNGDTYVKANRKVINSKSKSEQRKEITGFFNALLRNKPSLDIQTIEGDVLTITKTETANKARDDYRTDSGRRVKLSDNEFLVKLHATSHIDELAEVSLSPNKSPKQDSKDHSFAKDGFTYRTAYFEDFDGQYYRVTISVGHNNNIATVYNIGKTEGSVPPSAKIIAVVGSKALGETLPDNSIPNPDENVKQNFQTNPDEKSFLSLDDYVDDDSYERVLKRKNNALQEETEGQIAAIHKMFLNGDITESEMLAAENDVMKNLFKKVNRQTHNYVKMRRDRDNQRAAAKKTRSEVKGEIRSEMSETERKRILRESIRHRVKTFTNTLNANTNTRNIPDNLKGLTKASIGLINEGRFSTKGFNNLVAEYDRLLKAKDNPETPLGFDDDVAAIISHFSSEEGGIIGRKLAELSLFELNQLNTVYENIAHIIKNQQEVFVNKRKTTRKELVDMTIEQIKAMDDKLFSKIWADKFQGVKGWAVIDNIKPVYFFKEMGGVFEELFNDLRDGQDMVGRKCREAKNFLLAAKEKYNYYEWGVSKDKKDVFTLKGKQGSISLTREEALLVYAVNKREETNRESGGIETHHIDGGGIVPNNGVKQENGKYEVSGKAFKLSSLDIMELEKWLTDEQKAYADAVVGYLSNNVAEVGNELTLRMYGIKKYNERYYIPFESGENYISKKASELGEEKGKGNKVEGGSFTKAVTEGASTPIKLANFTDVAAKHIANMYSHCYVAETFRNFMTVYNGNTAGADKANPGKDGAEHRDSKEESVRVLISSKFGAAYEKYISQFLSDIEGGIKTDNLDKLGSRMLRRSKIAKTALSASVVIQQPTSILRAKMFIENRYFVKISKSQNEKLVEEMKKWNPVAIIKEAGGFDIGTTGGLSSYIAANDYKGWQKIKGFLSDSEYRNEAVGWAPQKADELTWAWIWSACKNKVLAENKGKFTAGSDEHLSAAAELFRDVIDHTQVYDSVLSRSGNMRKSSVFAKSMTMFMSEPTVTMNMAMYAGKQLKQGNVKAAGRIASGLLWSVVVNNMLKALVLAARDDDENEGYWEKYLYRFASGTAHDLNPFTYIPFVSSIAEIIEGYDVTNPSFDTVADAIGAVDSILKNWTSDNPKSWFNIAVEASTALSQCTGIPLTNLVKDIKAVFNIINEFDKGKTAGTTKEGAKSSLLSGFTDSGIPKILKGMKLIPAYTASDKQYAALYKAALNGDDKLFEAELRDLLERQEKKENEVRTGLIDYSAKNDKKVQAAADEHFQKLVKMAFYDDLTDKEKKQVKNELLKYEAGKVVDKKTDLGLRDEHIKATYLEDKGIEPEIWFAARKLGAAKYADTDNSGGKPSQKEYIAALKKAGVKVELARRLYRLKESKIPKKYKNKE